MSPGSGAASTWNLARFLEVAEEGRAVQSWPRAPRENLRSSPATLCSRGRRRAHRCDRGGRAPATNRGRARPHRRRASPRRRIDDLAPRQATSATQNHHDTGHSNPHTATSAPRRTVSAFAAVRIRPVAREADARRARACPVHVHDGHRSIEGNGEKRPLGASQVRSACAIAWTRSSRPPLVPVERLECPRFREVGNHFGHDVREGGRGAGGDGGAHLGKRLEVVPLKGGVDARPARIAVEPGQESLQHLPAFPALTVPEGGSSPPERGARVASQKGARERTREQRPARTRVLILAPAHPRAGASSTKTAASALSPPRSSDLGLTATARRASRKKVQVERTIAKGAEQHLAVDASG